MTEIYPLLGMFWLCLTNHLCNMKNVLIPPIILFIISMLTILLLAKFGNCMDAWLHRILGAFAASGLSVVIPGSINIGKPDAEFKTLAQESPQLTASGALAVFVLVYLFNPNW